MRKIIRSLGIVFGDIGTSPIYTLTVIFLIMRPTPTNIVGVLSLIFWTLITLVTVEYAWLATSLGKKGEGGTIVLRELLVPYLKSGRQVAFVTLLSFIGISLLVGDGVITPAISILSAVEGTLLIPGFENISQSRLIIVASLIAVLLFIFQKKGTERVAWAFGPIMMVWFGVLAVSGIASIYNVPSVLKAVNPYYGVKFMLDNGLAGFFVLSEVILCATGGEALYADMGHLGRVPIVKAWYFVFVVLVLNYMGQGAYVIAHPEAHNVLFEMIFSQAQILYVPFLLLSIAATVIASQAMISGMFSVVYQGITTHVMPLFKVDYTSVEMRSQIYISFVNWFLLIFVLFIIFEFRESHNLAAAYGLAVTGTMSLTGIMMTWIFLSRRNYFRMCVAIVVTLIDFVFLFSNAFKIPHGGYWSIIIALLPFSLIIIYTQGQKRLYKALRPLNQEAFLIGYNQIYKGLCKISGTALFFAKDAKDIAPYIVHTMFKNNIIYEDNVIVSIVRTDEPFGVRSYFTEDLAPGLRVFEISSGYMEVVDVEAILKDSSINEKTIFYGLEEITTSNIVWKIFSVIKKLTPTFLIFYKLPTNKLHGVITRVEM
ncbi:MAG: KUP/HAK/KT family potassium transporter [Deltaproteobacteria bacterium]|nr:KUP/HAK/KT family potassium transporter [Deltaproteobacteria bacterium]